MKLAAPAIALGLAGCVSTPPAGVPLTGQWGGRHIGLVLEQSGGRIEYDCASGTIGPVVPDARAQFTATGMHTPGWGGPEIVGQVRPTHRVRYTGSVRGERMTLHGRVENGVLLGPFTLRRGAEPGIFRCL